MDTRFFLVCVLFFVCLLVCFCLNNCKFGIDCQLKSRCVKRKFLKGRGIKSLSILSFRCLLDIQVEILNRQLENESGA